MCSYTIGCVLSKDKWPAVAFAIRTFFLVRICSLTINCVLSKDKWPAVAYAVKFLFPC